MEQVCSPPLQRDTRIYVWGCGPMEGHLLLERGQSTPEARDFARQRGWNAEASGSWALELAVPVALTGALAALEPVIRREASVIGYGGRTARTTPSGRWGQLLPPLSGARAGSVAAPIPPFRSACWGCGEAEARSDGAEARGHAVALPRAEQLRERMNTAMAHSRILCKSVVAAVGQARALRSQLREHSGARSAAMARGLLFQESEWADITPPTPVPGVPEQVDLTLPDSERAAVNAVMTHAHDLAAAGCLSAGYTVLLAGRRRAEHAAAAGENWAAQLVGVYVLALENYIASYGARL